MTEFMVCLSEEGALLDDLTRSLVGYIEIS